MVFGRAYNVRGWLIDAFADILAREEDLTEEEDARMSRGDLRAIAKGQRQLARTAEAPSRETARDMVFDLFPGEFDLERVQESHASERTSCFDLRLFVSDSR
jgi:hypothetical protein